MLEYENKYQMISKLIDGEVSDLEATLNGLCDNKIDDMSDNKADDFFDRK